MIEKFVISLWLNNIMESITMARPIAETPVLTGQDAVRFEKMRLEVESLTDEQRSENSRKLSDAVAKAKKYITISL